MRSSTPVPAPGFAPRLASGGRDLLLALPLHGVLLGLGMAAWALPMSWAVVSLVLHGVLAALVVPNAPRVPGQDGLGAANRVTLLRAMGVLPLGALALHPGAVTTPVLWGVVGIGTLVMVLDGVDGRVARRTGTETAFGARFDMELDAVFLLALSVLVWLAGPVAELQGTVAGAWVLLVGGMRYLFVLAARVEPRLRAPLPESRRRKTICVVQGVALLVALGPIVPAWLGATAVATALLLLAGSFGVDVRWLLGQAPAAPPGGLRDAGGG